LGAIKPKGLNRQGKQGKQGKGYYRNTKFDIYVLIDDSKWGIKKW
jgi:hypothetical protein